VIGLSVITQANRVKQHLRIERLQILVPHLGRVCVFLVKTEQSDMSRCAATLPRG
jgi:hypothetical protein